MRAAPEADGVSGAADDFPWNEAMGVAFGVFRMAPDTFWRMTPREFAHAVAPFVHERHHAPQRGSLDALMHRFPDRSEDRHERR